MNAVPPVTFPARQIPTDAAHARLLGLYPQIQQGLWLQRTKTLGGIMTPQQWRALAAIARRFTPATPLHLTTRQDIEIHDLAPQDVPLVQQEMAQAGITGQGACGDTVRNLTVCPCSGLQACCPDLAPLAWQIRQLLEAQNGVYALPRKFKISLSACADACAQPFISDVGFVAAKRNGTWGFRTIAAGSLGPRPNTGIEIFDWLPASDVLPFVLGALRVFGQHGDRTNRQKARLRHVRERLGNEPFVSMLKQAFHQARPQANWPDIVLAEPARPSNARVALSFLGGDVSPEAAEALADLASQADTFVRIANHHRIFVFAPDQPSLEAKIAGFPALREAAQPQPAIVACPGKRWCKHGLTHTLDMARQIRDELGTSLPPNLTVCISGCPNGCAQSSVGNIGLTGMRKTQDGVQHEVYNLLLNGGMGRDERLAQAAAQRLRPDEIIARLADRPKS